MKKETIIFDLDGVLARDGETRPFIEQTPSDFAGFNNVAGSVRGVPEMCGMADSLHEQGYEIVVFTARSCDTGHTTRSWLDYHGLEFAGLFMRRAEDGRPDFKVKADMVRDARDAGKNIVLAIDNCNDCLGMYKRLGIATLKVHYK